MEQRQSTSDGQTGVAAAPPAWMRPTTPYAPDRRAKMLEHMARVRSLPQRQAASVPAAPASSGQSGRDVLGDVIGHVVLFGVIALLFQSRVPLYIGAFLFLTDGARIESALGRIGIWFEPETIGPDIVKRSAFWFGWFALLASLKGSVPAWLAPWMPPAEPWPFIAGIALLLAIVEAVAALAMRRAWPWFGWEIRPDGPIWTTIKFAMAIGVLALLVLFGSL